MSFFDDYIKGLFRAFRDNDERAFYRIAENIISAELTSNHHSYARELRNALGEVKHRQENKLQSSPKNTRNNVDLLLFREPQVNRSRVYLDHTTSLKVDRVLSEWRNRSKLKHAGLSPKNKLLFWGPPGCGKTMTSELLASELGLPYASLNLSSIVSSYIGETSSNIRKILEVVDAQPTVLLIDEFDSLAKSRGDRQELGELKRVVNALLQELEGRRYQDSLIISATNHQHTIDDAFWRRFDDIVEFKLPNKEIRTDFIQNLLRGLKLKGELSKAVKASEQLSFAEIEKIIIDILRSIVLNDKVRCDIELLVSEIKTYKATLFKAKGYAKVE